mmetsp:Transcript_36667/g.98249  ORF Transcript_36667/g.98249 Transcript_36667/m.98249 type:complete len:540 (-) Transcript_36667:73-1692(-)
MGCVSSAPDSYVLQYAQGTNTRPEDTSWVATRVTSNPDGAWSEASFRWGAVLGRGKFGEVQLVKAEKDQLYYAVKSIPKEVIWERQGALQIQTELNTLADLSGTCPFICECFGAFQDEKSICILVEYLCGGEMFNRLRRAKKFSEPTAKFYSAEIALALAHLHESQIVYRDLKPENIMIDHMGHIRLIDFGFAQRLKSDNARLTSGCGTAMYLAPEIAEGKTNSAHGLPVDWWSLGCVIFEMLTGTAPFGDTADSNKFEIFNKIIKGKVKYPGYITTEAKSLLTGLICVDSGVRYKYADLHSHAWYKGVAWDAVLRCEMVPPWVPPIKDGEGDHGNFLDWKDNQPRRSRVTGDAVEYCNFKLPKSCMPKGGKWATAVVRQNSFTRTGVGVGGSGGTSANFGNTAAAAITMKKKLKTKRLSQVSPDSKKALKETGGTANSVEAGGAKAKGGVTRAGSSRELGRRSSGIKRQGPGQLARQGSGVKRQAASEGGTSPKLAPEILTSPKSGSGPRNGAVEKGGLARAPGGGGLNPKATPQGGR